MQNTAERPAVWQDGRYEWQYNGISETCPKYSAFDSNGWQTERKTYVDGNIMKAGTPDANELPTISLCEYIGKNLVPDGTYLAYGDYSQIENYRQLVGDRYWNHAAEGELMVWGTTAHTGLNTWLAIDLGNRYAIRMFRWQTVARQSRLEVYVTDIVPKEGEIPEESEIQEKYLLCGTFPDKKYFGGGHFNGNTQGLVCDCLLPGRYAFIRNEHGNIINLVLGEVAVFGIPLSDIY